MGGSGSYQETDSRVKFYEKYYKVAEEYDKVFMKKHEEDLNTTLIFVSTSIRDRRVSADGTHRLVCSLPLRRLSSSTSTNNCVPIRTKRPPPSSASSSTKSTTRRLEIPPRPSRNGPARPTRLYKSRVSSFRASPRHCSPRYLPCLASSG